MMLLKLLGFVLGSLGNLVVLIFGLLVLKAFPQLLWLLVPLLVLVVPFVVAGYQDYQKGQKS